MRKPRLRCKLSFVAAFFLVASHLKAQTTFPENGIADPRHGHYAFTNASIVKDATTTLTNATLVIKDGKIVAVGTNLKVPAGAVEVDCKGKFIYPSFIDIYADYGTPGLQRARWRIYTWPATTIDHSGQRTFWLEPGYQKRCGSV